VDVNLPYPRNFETRESEAYFQKLIEVREFLRESHAMDDTVETQEVL
jgi:hypothetical protein